MEESTVKVQRYTNVTPLWKMFILQLLTLGLYEIYWFYKNWRNLKDYDENLDVSPGWKTFGYLFPIVNIVFMYDQIKEIKERAEHQQIKETYNAGQILVIFIILTILWKLPQPLDLLSNLSILPLMRVQMVLNQYWQQVHIGELPTKKLYKGEIFVLILGILLWITQVADWLGYLE